MNVPDFTPNNRHSVPGFIRSKLSRIEGDKIVVSCAKKISADQIRSDRYAHLGLHMNEGEPDVPDSVVPPAEAGTYSRKNAEAWTKKHTDEPKITKYNYIESPNWGDWSKGSHVVALPYKKYPTEEISPTRIPIEIDWLATEAMDTDQFVIRFTVGNVLDRTAEDFEEKLLRDINLLQENIGHADVFPPDAPKRAYIDRIYVDWEILPPGDGQPRHRVLPDVKGSSSKEREEVAERYTFLEELGPTTFIEGRHRFERYFGAMFGEEVVVFENLTYGNAVYVMEGNWRELSKMSRTELIEERPDGVTRIVHRDGWKEKVKKVVGDLREESSNE